MPQLSIKKCVYPSNTLYHYASFPAFLNISSYFLKQSNGVTSTSSSIALIQVSHWSQMHVQIVTYVVVKKKETKHKTEQK